MNNYKYNNYKNEKFTVSSMLFLVKFKWEGILCNEDQSLDVSLISWMWYVPLCFVRKCYSEEKWHKYRHKQGYFGNGCQTAVALTQVLRCSEFLIPERFQSKVFLLFFLLQRLSKVSWSYCGCNLILMDCDWLKVTNESYIFINGYSAFMFSLYSFDLEVCEVFPNIWRISCFS